MEKKWIHLDRFNRIIQYSSTEKGANPKHPNDLSDGVTMSIPKFAIDDRKDIIKVIFKREIEEQEEKRKTRELLLKGDVQKQEEEELERKRKEGQRQEQEMKRQRQYELAQERQEEQRQAESDLKLTMRLNRGY